MSTANLVLALVICFGLLSGGCSFIPKCSFTDKINNIAGYKQGNFVEPEMFASLIEGKTSKHEVLASLGRAQTMDFHSGNSIMTYKYTLISAIGPNEEQTITLVFNQGDILLEKMHSDSGSDIRSLMSKQ